MGIDFIKKTTDTFQKSWDQNKKFLSEPDLFTKYPENLNRSIIAKINNEQKLNRGDEIIIQLKNENIHIIKDTSEVATAIDLPPNLEKEIRDIGGIASGKIKHVNKLGGTIDVSLT